MSGRSKQIIQWIVFVVVGLCAMAALAVSFAAVATPGCEWCHDQDAFVKNTTATAHGETDCSACHVKNTVAGRVEFGAREVFHMVIPVVKTVDRSVGSVPDTTCLSCHEQIENPAVVGSHGLRIKHQSCIGERSCVDCHSTTAHGASTRWPRVPIMDDCFTCHGVSNKITDCDACHAERDEQQRVEAGTFQVTHGPEWKTTHGMGDMLTCDSCHTAAKCSTCHGVGVPHEDNFVRKHAEYSTDPKAECTTCHLQSFCDDCHTYPMPHSQKFILEHSDTVEKDGKQRCLTCHDEGDCTQCHVEHIHPVTQEQMDGFMLKSPSGGE